MPISTVLQLELDRMIFGQADVRYRHIGGPSQLIVASALPGDAIGYFMSKEVYGSMWDAHTTPGKVTNIEAVSFDPVGLDWPYPAIYIILFMGFGGIWKHPVTGVTSVLPIAPLQLRTGYIAMPLPEPISVYKDDIFVMAEGSINFTIQ